MLSQTDDGRSLTRRERLRFAGVLCVFALTVALVAQCFGCGAASPRVALPELYRPAVTRLEIVGLGKCTAWKLSEDLVATAGHCCNEGAEYVLGSAPVGTPSPVVLVDDDVHDVCVLRGKMAGDPIALASEDPAVGAPVWTAGYPVGWFLISSGFWSGRDEDNEGVCSVVVAGGASGSPILDVHGRAVGVLIKKIQGMDNLTLVATIEHLRAARDLAMNNRNGEPMWISRPVKPVPAAPAGPSDGPSWDELLRQLENIRFE